MSKSSKHQRHMFLRMLAVMSAICCIAIVLLRFRSSSTSDVLMVPLGGHNAMLLTSQCGFGDAGWCEINFVGNWPGPRFGLWSGAGWKDVGPLLIQWRVQHYFSTNLARLMAGSFMTPKDGPTGPISCQNSYRRAEQLGFPNTLAPPPESAVVYGCRLQVPHIVLIVPFLLLLLILTIRFIRRRRRKSATGCPVCGYDLRATPDRCPECGTVPAK